MNRRVDVRLAAELDAMEYAEYIAGESPDSAARFLEGVNESLVRIGRNAGIGHSRETLNSKLVGVRAYHVVGFPNHLVFYRVLDNSTVRILRIRHGAMDMDAVPMDDDE